MAPRWLRVYSISDLKFNVLSQNYVCFCLFLRSQLVVMALAYATEHTPAAHSDKLLLSIAIMRSEDWFRDRNSLDTLTAFSDTNAEPFMCKTSGGGQGHLL
jgi:hypothetical protein